MMIFKKLKSLFYFSIIHGLLSFQPSNSAQIECVSVDGDGYFTVKIWDVQKGAKYQFENARKDAIYIILYSGFAGNNFCNKQLPFLRSQEERENFKRIEKAFFEKKGKWSLFTRRASIESTIPENIGNKNWKVYQVSIAKSELRKFLEEENILKSLNTGF